jgi:hypothetical protein
VSRVPIPQHAPVPALSLRLIFCENPRGVVLLLFSDLSHHLENKAIGAKAANLNDSPHRPGPKNIVADWGCYKSGVAINCRRSAAILGVDLHQGAKEGPVATDSRCRALL